MTQDFMQDAFDASKREGNGALVMSENNGAIVIGWVNIDRLAPDGKIDSLTETINQLLTEFFNNE